MHQRSKHFLVLASLGLAALLAPSALRAETYTFSAIASGLEGGTPFSDIPFTVTLSTNATGSYASGLTATASADGETGTVSGLYLFFNPLCTGGMPCIGIGQTDDLIDIASNALSGYSLGENIGPVSDANPITNSTITVDTSIGTLHLTDISMTDGTVTATGATPEPSSLLLLGSGLLGFASMMRRKLAVGRLL